MLSSADQEIQVTLGSINIRYARVSRSRTLGLKNTTRRMKKGKGEWAYGCCRLLELIGRSDRRIYGWIGGIVMVSWL